MPLIFLAVGVLFLVSAVRGTQGSLLALLKDDFTGQNNFLIWIAAVAMIGLIGLVDDFRAVSNAFLGLIVLVILISNKGFFSQLTAGLATTQQKG
jgi:hypothetical protein